MQDVSRCLGRLPPNSISGGGERGIVGDRDTRPLDPNGSRAEEGTSGKKRIFNSLRDRFETNADLAIRATYEGALIEGLPADKVKAGDEREIQQMKDLQLVKETDILPNKSILLTGWARRLKGREVRSRCVLKDFATTVRDDVFAPTPSPLPVRGLLLDAAWFDLRVETGDLVCAFMQADSSFEMFARLPKGQERDGWMWRLHGAMKGMRTASRHFTEFLAGTLSEYMGFKRGKLE